MRTSFWLFTEVVRKIPIEVTRKSDGPTKSPKGQDNGSGTPSVLAASYADKLFTSTAQLWFEIKLFAMSTDEPFRTDYELLKGVDYIFVSLDRNLSGEECHELAERYFETHKGDDFARTGVASFYGNQHKRG